MINIRFELVDVKLKSEKVDLKSGLLKSLTLPWAPIEIDSSKALPKIAEAVPLGTDVVEWMQMAAADVAVFEAMCEEYNRAGSELVSDSGDANIPGVRAGDIRGESVNANVVRSRGYGTVITPRGNFNVRIGSKVTFAKADILAWAALPFTYGVQWLLTLLQWKDLARAPITNRIRFASSHGLVAPNFFLIPATFAPIRTLRVGITSDNRQTLTIRGRGTKGSYENVLFEDKVDIDSGENEFIYNVFGFPSVGAFTLEIQPQDNTQTVLDYIDIFPP
ncbi:MAG: hypothetical protein QXH55_05625 [Candidatus Korarchaeota archaeon]|nr:hypothetical protein [Thermoproteota archaeon]